MTMTVGVVGAGLMGSEIALVQALAGHRVLLNDRDGATVDAALARIAQLLDRGVARDIYQPADRDRALALIEPALDMAAFTAAQVVTEAVFENEDVKREVLAAIDAAAPAACIIATITSTIPISTLASFVSPARRAHFVGTHYFSPVSRMKLVEVIPAFETSEEVVGRITDFVAQAGKTPIRVKDVAGFAVNRMLHVFIIEAVRLVEEGVATPEDIDTACRLGLGHSMGPFALMDAVTSSLCVQAQEIMQEAYGERFRPPPLLKQRVRAGLSGGRNQRGWLAT
ncbi:3-hydroxyacyl-CoA dehydrogenase family protein [Sphingomonas sp. MG17]|uniref:3-hydroxyacyl-CoA dehydrogenase family protein n=1 Tax=Sphingomonas tagetis TaxID=2949092 RepID=A0A9X2KM22_9SPHN|nr:3-hydroxyacyl-CoA dehydrogenase family protein [Sphingomonas tagetis]MCP3731217.1 3-hydroxyacyl-CoA dehydrogenase family protein [Sphingomonas tagetis]